MISIDFIIKRHNTFIKNYNSLKAFQDKLDFEKYSFEELEKLKEEIDKYEYDSSDLITKLKVNVDLWLDIKKGAIHYPMINKYDYLSQKEKRTLDEYLYNNPKGILDYKILKNKNVYKDLINDKIITLYSYSCKCPVCGTELSLKNNKCPLCDYDYSNLKTETIPKFVLNRK